MDNLRKPYQGTWNIIRFNWHFYVLAAVVISLTLLLQQHFPAALQSISTFLVLLICCFICISLLVSFYIYDCSNLYKLPWWSPLQPSERIINIHAGFDETSSLLKQKFETCELVVADFYDPEKHTEVSIKRARKAYPPFPNTLQVSTTHLPIQNSSADMVFLFLSAHEIRSEKERVVFFKEVQRVLKPAGQVIITEHLRDTANFLAYNIGFLHFHSSATWLRTFSLAGLRVSKEIKTTPFITTFILENNGAAS